MSCREKGGASGKSIELGNCGIGDTKEAKEDQEKGRKKALSSEKGSQPVIIRYDGS